MIVLDTHAWIWLVDGSDRLGARAAAAIGKARREGAVIHVSSISVWELYMLADKGRLSLAVAPEIWVARCENLSFLRFHPVDNEVARLAVVRCGAMHADPADRIVVATALYLGASLVTADERMHRSGIVKCLW